MKKLSVIILVLISSIGNGQGLNHNYLIGYTIADPPWTTHDKGVIKIDSSGFGIFGLSRKMKFRATQSNISDDSGNIKFYTNGCWIANALEDTMLNGSGIATDLIDSQWCSTAGIQWIQPSLILPMPDDSNKYVLFHHGNSYVNPPDNLPLISYYSVIDMALDSGLGGVISGQKKVPFVQDKLLPGFTACRHANGQDWWVVILRDSSDIIYITKLTPQGVQSPVAQSLGIPNHNAYIGQLVFSPDGNKFAYRYYHGGFGNMNNEVRIFDFDRCTGLLANPQIISWPSQFGSLGLSFSSNSKYLYTVSDFDTIYQMNTDTSNIQTTMQVVAINDGYYSPQPPFQTDFWTMYLASNGKIILSSGSGVVDLHYISFPDSSGIACDVQLHALPMPCYTFRSHVNHPNYYLGCDTTLGCPCLITGIDEAQGHDFRFSVSPNPANGQIKIIYLLPQNKDGRLEVFDVNGRKVYSQSLPPWSTLQTLDVSFLSNGVYQCVVSSGVWRNVRKLVVVKD